MRDCLKEIYSNLLNYQIVTLLKMLSIFLFIFLSKIVSIVRIPQKKFTTKNLEILRFFVILCVFLYLFIKFCNSVPLYVYMKKNLSYCSLYWNVHLILRNFIFQILWKKKFLKFSMHLKNYLKVHNILDSENKELLKIFCLIKLFLHYNRLSN